MAAPLDPQYIDQIKGFEGYSPAAAWDYKQSSSGYGTKAQPGDENIPPDQLKAVHEQRLNDEIAKAAAHVDSINPDLPPGARAALISLTYNAGPGWAKAGLGDLVRAGDLQGAQQRILEYNKAGGKVLPGLVDRRAKEASWFEPQSNQLPQTASSAPQTPVQAPMGILRQPTAAPQPRPQQTAQASPVAPQAAPLAPAPQAPPIFAQAAPQAAPQQQASPSYFGQMPAEQAMTPLPIMAHQRKPVDISKLRAALQASSTRPIFG